MRKFLLGLAVLAIVAAACAPEDDTTEPADSGTSAAEPVDAATCAADATLVNDGTLTIATGNPAYKPWYGGKSVEDSEWESGQFTGDPHSAEGYESAFAYALAEELGFTEDQVQWLGIPFNKSFAPGPKDFDFVLQQISYKPERDDAVDFSESYYNVNQALVSAEGTSVADATTIADLKDAKLGAPIGTTSLDVITDQVQPTQEPAVYDDLAQAVTDLQNGDIDGIVVDLPTAFFMAAVQIKHGVVVGQFGAESDEYFAMAFETGSPLVQCVDLALEEMKADGTLDDIEQQWLADKTNAPVLD